MPWLDWAEEKVAADLPRPAQLEEATEILQQCQHFEDQCIDKEPAVKVGQVVSRFNDGFVMVQMSPKHYLALMLVS